MNRRWCVIYFVVIWMASLLFIGASARAMWELVMLGWNMIG
jgi:hypothetical protein